MMNLRIGDEYADVIYLTRRDRIFISDAEEAILGVDHTYFGALLGEKWDFPEKLLDAIANRHKKYVRGEVDILEIVSLADNIAKSFDPVASGDCKETELDVDSFSQFGIDKGEEESFLSTARVQISVAQGLKNLF